MYHRSRGLYTPEFLRTFALTKNLLQHTEAFYNTMGAAKTTPTLTFQGKEYYCSLELAMDMIGGKWKPMMIFHLKDGAMRSSDLMRKLQGISNKMFTQTARELEYNGLMERIVYPVVPPKVEYRLTALGMSVLPIIQEMAEWGIFIGTHRQEADTPKSGRPEQGDPQR